MGQFSQNQTLYVQYIYLFFLQTCGHVSPAFSKMIFWHFTFLLDNNGKDPIKIPGRNQTRDAMSA